MDRVIILDKDNKKIGLTARHNTPGTEYELVLQFIDYYCDQFLRNNRTRNLAVFVEPRISSGFPDIVFASYMPSIIDAWSVERTRLDTCDLKVLSFIMNAHACGGNEILSALKLSERQGLTSIEKLIDAKLIERNRGSWKLCSQADTFSIKKLLAVEAKVNDMRRVTEQSLLNTWFASQSYALSNAACPSTSTLENFQKHGIGLYCKCKGFRKVLEAKRLLLPSSYLSLQFNEWIGNSLQHA